MNKLRFGVELWRMRLKTLSFLSCSVQTSVCRGKKAKIELDVGQPNKSADKPKPKKSLKVIAKIKKLNWENVNLYGPLLKTSDQTKQRLDNSAVVEAECSGLIAGGENNREQKKHVKVRVIEAGDRDQLESTVVCSEQLSTQIGDTVFEFTLAAKPRSRADKKGKEDVRSAELNGLKSDDSTLSLKHFPLCVGGGEDELLTRKFHTYCQKILGIDSELSLLPASVTTILQQSMSEESRAVLENWENQMIEKLGLAGFHKFKQELFAVGRLLHKTIETRLCGQLVEEEDVDERVKGYWKSVGHVFKDISQVQLLETKVDHPILRYKGILDCVAKYRDSDVLVEWKTSQRPRISLKDIYDNPLQVAAYAGALNYGQHITQQVNRGLVVIAYSSGAPAHVHYLDQRMMEHYWSLWLQRLEKYFLLSHPLHYEK